MAKSVQQIISDAKVSTQVAKGKVDNLYVMIGTIPGDTPRMLGFKGARVSLQAEAVESARARGGKIFGKFAKYLQKAVCDDFGYCAKKEAIQENLDKYLPDIVKAILKRIPVSGKLPGWLAAVLRVFGIAATSAEVLVTMFVAWIIIEGCDKLCACKE